MQKERSGVLSAFFPIVYVLFTMEGDFGWCRDWRILDAGMPTVSIQIDTESECNSEKNALTQLPFSPGDWYCDVSRKSGSVVF